MAKINPNELTKEQIETAMVCETAEELMALAKAEGFDLTKDEAESYLVEMEEVDLTDAELKHAAGGSCYTNHCPDFNIITGECNIHRKM